jgi:hypothetical protein
MRYAKVWQIALIVENRRMNANAALTVVARIADILAEKNKSQISKPLFWGFLFKSK